ncbi:MAG: hypothetical protein HQ477_11560 [Chloroflexi bacterium]|nr:hypothetical protein [Chloroflexota bacterium]
MPRRKASWAIWVWTAIMALSTILTVTNASNGCPSEDSLCELIFGSIGGIIIVMMLVPVWFIGFIVTLLIWLLTRQKKTDTHGLRE